MSVKRKVFVTERKGSYNGETHIRGYIKRCKKESTQSQTTRTDTPDRCSFGRRSLFQLVFTVN